MIRIAAIATTLALLVACLEDDTCDRWANQECTCFGESSEECTAARNVAASAESAVVDECEQALSTETCDTDAADTDAADTDA